MNQTIFKLIKLNQYSKSIKNIEQYSKLIKLNQTVLKVNQTIFKLIKLNQTVFKINQTESNRNQKHQA